AQILKRQLALLPRPFLLNSWLFIDTHDTPRAITVLGDAEKVKAALAFIYTWVGTPMLYYGDEVYLEGGPDPDNRRCMDWERRDGLHEILKALIRLEIRPKYLIAHGNEVIYYDENYEVRISNEPKNYRDGILVGEYFAIRSR
ncbi:MAG: alpha-amylase family glycosyl hydrolase, partial [Vulcanisaeta sp.]